MMNRHRISEPSDETSFLPRSGPVDRGALPPEDPRQRYALLLHRAGALWRTRLDARLRPWGMSQSTWRLLWLLRNEGNGFNQSALAARLGIETPTLVRLIDRMEAKGWVSRLPDEKDRRQKRVGITEPGLRVTLEIEREVVAVREEMLAGIESAVLDAGIALLERLVVRAGGAG